MPQKPRFPPAALDRALEILRGASRARPVTSEELGAQLGIDDIEGNWVGRGLIYEVMRQRRVPVVATSQGYFIASDYEDVRKYVDDLNRRAIGTVGRAALVDLLWHENHPDEPTESE